MVKISFTNGALVNFTLLEKIVAARIGSVAFFDPEIDITPDSSFFPFISNFRIKDLKSWEG